MKRLRRVLLAFALVLVALLVAVKCAYGGGRPYPDVSTPPRIPDGDVVRAVGLDFPLGNVTGTSTGRIFFNLHPFAQAHRFTDAFLFELVDGEPRPYPSAAAQAGLRHMFGMTADRQGRLWLVSPAALDRPGTRLIAYDLATDERVVDHTFASGVARFAQDMRVLPDGRRMILADTGAFHFTSAALLVLDLETFAVRRVLAGHPSTQPQDWFIRTDRGPHRIGFGLITFAVGVDGIALSDDGVWAYYATMSHDSLYRVRTADLLDASLDDADLGRRVERVGPKPLSDGIAVTADGAVLITDIENGGIARLSAGGDLETLTRSRDVVWADGVHVTPTGEVWFTDSAIPSYLDPLLRAPSRAALRRDAPHGLYRFRLP
ncbi:MAG: SMP-30/gluconolactonase/LRE family protein [Sandaracinaceae bacterium]